MRNIIIITLIITLPFSLFAQQNEVEKVLTSVESNNKMLKTFQKQLEVRKLENSTGIYLQNPEVGFNYLFGKPSEMGNRMDISITQTFDFPTVYKHQKQISKLKNEQLVLEFAKQKREVLLKARYLCSDLTYLNAKVELLIARQSNAENISDKYKKKLGSGEISIIEYNKSELNLLKINNQLVQTIIEQQTILSSLRTLNANEPIAFNSTEFIPLSSEGSFEDWYLEAEKKSPVLAWLKQEIEINEQEKKLVKANNYPKITAGYMSERLTNETFQGITFGVSIPLWENKNKTKLAQAKIEVAETLVEQQKFEFYNELQIQRKIASELQKTLVQYKSEFEKLSNTALLKKALDAGQINILQYFTEISDFYESEDAILEMEHEIDKKLVLLKSFE